MDDRDELWMCYALNEAYSAARIGEVPIGAVVVFGDRIIGRGYNVREHTQDPTGHAEIVAMRQAAQSLGAWRLQDCDLYVTLEPCPMCAGAIVQARIRSLIYGAPDPKAGYVGSLYDVLSDKRLNHSTTVTKGVLAQQCGALLSTFFRSLRTARYCSHTSAPSERN
jgi:tRNA(adenine34) deaminase